MSNAFTYDDAVHHALDFLGGTPDALALRDARRSVQNAYRELTNFRNWTYFYNHLRIVTNPVFTAGYVAYVASGGTYARELLLYGATWPSWAGPGCKIRVGVVTADVLERRSDTTLTLTNEVSFPATFDYAPRSITGLTLASPLVITSPGHGLVSGPTRTPQFPIVLIEGMNADVTGLPLPYANGSWAVTVIDVDTFSLNASSAAGLAATPWDGVSGTWRLPPTTSYTLYQDDYLLPEDFIRQDTMVFEGNFGGLSYSDPTDQLWFQRFTYSAGTPRFYTIRGSKLFPGRLVVGLFPYPDITKTIDAIYQRRGRSLRWQNYTAGTITLTSTSTVATAPGAAFVPAMAGSVLRIGTATEVPGPWVSDNPPAQELLVLEVLSPTQLRLDEVPVSDANVQYILSDPVDLNDGSMLSAFVRGVDRQMAICRHLDDRSAAQAAYDMALREACAADSVSYQGQAMGGQRPRWIHPKYYPAIWK